MAKTNKTEKYTKAIIDIEGNTITEIAKDSCKMYSLREFLQRWNGVSNISITFSVDDEIPEIEE